jgi:hypothetical protein
MRLTKDQLYKPYSSSAAAAAAAASAAENIVVEDVAGNFSGANVEAVLAELQDNIDSAVAGDIATHVNADGSGGTSAPATNKVHNAAAIELEDSGSLFTATDVEAALAEQATTFNGHKNADGAGGTNAPATNKVHNAAAVEVGDSGGYFDATDVEAALAEEAVKRIQSKHYFSEAADDFPVNQSFYRNHSADNTKSTSDSTPITISSIDTTNGTFGGVAYDGYIVLSWVPYRPSLFAPTAGSEWALLDLEAIDGDPDPDRFGDYTLRLKIIGGVYADKKLYYVVDYGSEGSLATTHRVLIYNPHEEANGWEWINSGNYVIGPGAAGSWRDLYTECSGIFQHSDGRFIMLVTGWKSGSPKVATIGAFESTDLVTWSVMNSDAAIFTTSSSTWRHTLIFGGSGLHYLDHEERYFLPCLGKDSSGRYTLGWVKFDEDFSVIEYAVDEPVTRNASYDHYYPACVHYGGRWRITYTVDEAPPDVYSWKYKEAFSNRPEGPYTGATDIFSDLSTMKSNDGLFCSSHFTDIKPFVWRGRLYALAFGCSKYKTSGNRGNLEMGLLYWNERLATPAWEIDPRSPIFFNAMYASSTLWGSNFTWQNDHIGGRISFYQHNDYLYLFHGGAAGTDTYKVCGRRLRLT